VNYKINDGKVEATINSFGAELKSLTDMKTGEEFMWDANPEYWNRTSPVLFPIVGGLKGGVYTHNNKEYEMGQHGFARDNEFVVVSKEDSKILFLLNSTEESMKIYPFEFKFYIEYSLKGGKLNIQYRVENPSSKELLFSIGAHPAFSTPTDDNIKFSDYYLEFEKKETASIYPLEGRNISRKTIEFLKDENRIDLTEDRFENDALIFKNLDSKKVSLKCQKNDRIVEMDYSDFEYIAFWNKVGAKFVCLEPWNGIADFTDASGKLKEKDGIIKLEGNKNYVVNLGITIKV